MTVENTEHLGSTDNAGAAASQARDAAQAAGQTGSGIAGLHALVGEWLTLPDAAEQLDVGISKLRRLVEERHLLALRVGEPPVLRTPAAFIKDGSLISSLRGTVIVLQDAGYSDEEAIEWLFTPDESLPGRPIDQLREGRKAEVRRRAQALGF